MKPSSAIERTNMMPKKTLFAHDLSAAWYFEERTL